MKNEITNRSEEEELKSQRDLKFAHISRVNGIRELAHMLSHELSQPLMVIAAYASGCIRRMEEDVYDKAQIIDAMKAVGRQVEKAGKLIHHMKDCVDVINLQYEQINIHQLIENTVSMIAYEFTSYPVAIHYEFAEQLPFVEIDAAQIKLVMLCLLKNAIEEMSEANTKRPQLIIETVRINERAMSVCVKDSGRGIPSEIKKKLFNARFTTKSNNIGMSLASCRSIIEAHRGTIMAESLRNGGAAFKFVLLITQDY